MRADLVLACALCVLRATTNGVVDLRWAAVVELFQHDTVLKTILIAVDCGYFRSCRLTRVILCEQISSWRAPSAS